MGEMVAFLPTPGALFTIPGRVLTKEIVSPLLKFLWLSRQGFACGCIYWLSYAMDFANKGLTFANYMSYWTDAHPAIFITCFYALPISFNLLNVRRFGEISWD